MESGRNQNGIQQLLAAEQEAQHIVNAARNYRNIESDTDTGPEEDSHEHYQPISAVNHDNLDTNGLVNGYLPGDNTSEAEGSEEEEEEKEREERESAILRAYREDEERRNAPLSEENAVQVMEAMRGVSFQGLAPDWVGRVPEEEWIHRLRRLRAPAAPTS